MQRRIVLFDIDGTLILCGSASRRALRRALEEVLGDAGGIDTVRCGGKTDPIIVREARPDAADVLDPGHCVGARFWSRYVIYLDQEMGKAHDLEVLPGARALLESLALRDDVRLGLITGNIPEGARIKLRHAGLDGFFYPEVLGAFGTDGATKDVLGGVLRARAACILGEAIREYELVMVGDAPSDITCANDAGFRSVAVATGSFSAEVLSASGPAAILPSLAPVERAVATLLS